MNDEFILCFIILFNIFIKTSITKDYIWYFWEPQNFNNTILLLHRAKHTSEAQTKWAFPSLCINILPYSRPPFSFIYASLWCITVHNTNNTHTFCIKFCGSRKYYRVRNFMIMDLAFVYRISF